MNSGTSDKVGSPSPNQGTGSLLRRVIVVMLAAVLLYGAMVLYGGLAEIRSGFEHYAWWTLGGACGLAFLNYLLRFLKLHNYLIYLKLGHSEVN